MTPSRGPRDEDDDGGGSPVAGAVVSAAALRASAGVVLVLALVAAVVRGRAGEAAGAAMVGLLIAAPVVRLAVLLGVWGRLGDTRFVGVGLVLLGVLLLGAAVAVVAS